MTKEQKAWIERMRETHPITTHIGITSDYRIDRNSKVTEGMIQEWKRLREEGYLLSEIARMTGTACKATIGTYLKHGRSRKKK